MKTIGLLGGTGWASTINYYTLLNERVNERLGGNHSAKILLKSIDYHDISSFYGNDDTKVAELLKLELQGLLALKPDCFMICCNTLHKFYNMIQKDLHSTVPIFHAVNLVAEFALKKNYCHVLLLATKFTMEDGFFANILKAHGLEVTIPNQEERLRMESIHAELMENRVTEMSSDFLKRLIEKNGDLDAVVLGCTEYPLIVNSEISALTIIDPVQLQTRAAVDYSLG